MEISKEFRYVSGIIYPPFAVDFFERYFYNYVMERGSEKIKRRYIPVWWTEINNSKYNKEKLQNELNKLKENSYFAVVQHADGIREKLPNGTRVYFMGGGGGGKGGINASEVIKIPLIYDNAEILRKDEIEKKYLISFIGANTHPCRLEIVNKLKNKHDVALYVDKWTNKITDEKQDLFIRITKQSKFTLSPRGYGPTSFRLYEALKLGSVPIYIYDNLWLPYEEIIDWSKMIILVHISEIDKLYDRVSSISEYERREMIEYYEKYSYLFDYEGLSKYIIEREEDIE